MAKMKETPIEISIDGNTIPFFKELKLIQKVNTHHLFHLTLAIESGEHKDTHTIEKSKDWLGKRISIWYGENLFLGIITHMVLNREHDAHGQIVLSGYSKTFLLETAPNLHSWTDKSLRQIVSSLIEPIGLKSKLKPEFDKPIDYQCQYQESDFQFIQRLAKQYYEWLFYDGEYLIFGKPESSQAIDLEYGKDLQKIELGMETLAKPDSAFFYHSFNTERHTSSSPDTPSGLNLLGQSAFQSSIGLFQHPGKRFASQRVRTKSDLDREVKKSQESQAAASHYIKASSYCDKLKVGSLIDITSTMNKGRGEFDNQIVGAFLITEITHFVSEGNYYSNSFKAIPSVAKTLPVPEVALPVAQTQIATVLSNDDPDGRGRVQVRMQWQTGNMHTSWLRVLSPNAGSSDEASKNRGFVFVPEKGDEVLVGFRYDDPNRPFVMGSLYNGSNTEGGGKDNNTKSIITRSGHQIVFDDTIQKESIIITDKKGNLLIIDTTNSSIRISAPETIDIEAKNINIKATEKLYQQAQNMEMQVQENLEIGVGGTMNTIVEESCDLHTSELSQTIEGSKIVDIKENFHVNSSQTEIVAGNGDINLQGAGVATLQGGQDVKVSKG